MCCELIVHSADISNPIKPWDISKEWSLRCLEEYSNQVDIYLKYLKGDKERALEY